MKDYINKVFLAPDVYREGGAGIAQINTSDYDDYGDGYTSGISSNVEFRDCSEKISLEFDVYAKSRSEKNVKTLRKVIRRRREKLARLVNFVSEFAVEYENRLAELEDELDALEKAGFKKKKKKKK